MKKCIVLFAVMLMITTVHAQPGPAPYPGAGAEAAPLDGFTWALLLAGAGYAAKTLRTKKENSEEDSPES